MMGARTQDSAMTAAPQTVVGSNEGAIHREPMSCSPKAAVPNKRTLTAMASRTKLARTECGPTFVPGFASWHWNCNNIF